MSDSTLKVSLTRQIPLPPEVLWQSATNSDTFNRLALFPTLKPSLSHDDDALNLQGGEFRLAGIKLGTQFDPRIEWVAPHWFLRERHINFGPIASLLNIIVLKPVGSGATEVTYSFDIKPARGFRWLVKSGLFILRNRVHAFLERLALEIADSSPKQWNAPKTSTNEAALNRLIERLLQYRIDPSHAEALKKYLIESSDDELQRIRPLRFAEAIGIEPLVGVRLFLVGASVGIFDLHWEVICPNCRGTLSAPGDLKQLTSKYHCDTCRLDMTSNFDQAVEATFSPTPAVRDINRADYCYGYPALTPHVELQMKLPDDEPRWVTPTLSGRFICWIAPLGVREPVDLPSEGWELEVALEGLTIRPRREGSRIVNRTGKPLLMQFQSSPFPAGILTAAQMTSLQDFRDLFAAQLLTPDVSLSVRHITFLFTDLKGSTEMYVRLGDAPAFSLVKDHFGVMREVIRSHRGGIVKTIGDAVMAVFTSPVEALEAACEIQSKLAASGLTVKMGLHGGGCIAITQNDILDYFGTTVNTAARVESASAGGDIVISESLYELPEISGLIASFGLQNEALVTNLKGLAGATKLRRLTSSNWTTPSK